MENEFRETVGELFPMITRRLGLARDIAFMAQACANSGDIEGAYDVLQEINDFMNEPDTLMNVAAHMLRSPKK